MCTPLVIFITLCTVALGQTLGTLDQHLCPCDCVVRDPCMGVKSDVRNRAHASYIYDVSYDDNLTTLRVRPEVSLSHFPSVKCST